MADIKGIYGGVLRDYIPVPGKKGSLVFGVEHLLKLRPELLMTITQRGDGGIGKLNAEQKTQAVRSCAAYVAESLIETTQVVTYFEAVKEGMRALDVFKRDPTNFYPTKLFLNPKNDSITPSSSSGSPAATPPPVRFLTPLGPLAEISALLDKHAEFQSPTIGAYLLSAAKLEMTVLQETNNKLIQLGLSLGGEEFNIQMRALIASYNRPYPPVPCHDISTDSLVKLVHSRFGHLNFGPSPSRPHPTRPPPPQLPPQQPSAPPAQPAPPAPPAPSITSTSAPSTPTASTASTASPVPASTACTASPVPVVGNEEYRNEKLTFESLLTTIREQTKAKKNPVITTTGVGAMDPAAFNKMKTLLLNINDVNFYHPKRSEEEKEQDERTKAEDVARVNGVFDGKRKNDEEYTLQNIADKLGTVTVLYAKEGAEPDRNGAVVCVGRAVKVAEVVTTGEKEVLKCNDCARPFNHSTSKDGQVKLRLRNKDEHSERVKAKEGRPWETKKKVRKLDLIQTCSPSVSSQINPNTN